MKIYKQPETKTPFLTVVACQHGNEPFGLRVIEALKPKLDSLPGLQLIIANEEALAINERGTEGDLNRSYPGDPNGNHESRLAHELLGLVKDSQYVLDIHTSVSSCGFLVPIIAERNERTDRIINHLPSANIVTVQKPLADTSLIGNVQGGLSLEFQESLTGDSKAVNLTLQLIEQLYTDAQAPKRERQLFTVTGILPKELQLPETAKDFELVPELNLYPVLLKDASYMGNQGLKATKKETVLM